MLSGGMCCVVEEMGCELVGELGREGVCVFEFELGCAACNPSSSTS